ncbi:unnamed protein product [Adineta steineri]|uniref:Uncharacterized protein n=1 Tax=Adineta steineri TaxID=433720 RepID=A0A818KAI6_9BILA|nr:unnamed protein product [Adineta steineri]
MNEKATRRMPSSVKDTNQPPVASTVDEKKPKVTVIVEENGSNELQEEITASAVVDPEENLLTEEQIKEFFKATEEGSIERLDELFDKTPYFNPNMTHYTESLLMTAIRAKQHKVAEYLIDQLAINVDQTSELLEFNTSSKVPIQERNLSSRDLAYDEGMMDLVDLIDIAGTNIKPCTKRFLQRRVKPRIDELHQAYLKRKEERAALLLLRQEEKEAEESSAVNVADDTELPASTPPPPPPPSTPPPPPPPAVDRLCKSHIQETLESIQSPNDKSIDETGKKYFRFSGYTVRYRIIDTVDTNKQIKEQAPRKKDRLSFPLIPVTNSRLLPSSLSRSKTILTTSNLSSYSLNDMRTQIPIRETRTSICRSDLHRTISRAPSRVGLGYISEMKPTTRTTISTTPRILSKPNSPINTNYSYVSPLQSTVNSEPRRLIPITSK